MIFIFLVLIAFAIDLPFIMGDKRGRKAFKAPRVVLQCEKNRTFKFFGVFDDFEGKISGAKEEEEIL